MRKFYVILAALAVLVAFSTPAVFAQAAKADQKEATVSGKLIDAGCYAKLGKEKAVASGHDACNVKCAKNGLPVAIFTAKDEIVTVTGDFTANNNAKLVDLMSKQVEAKGHITEKDGKKELHVTSIKEIDTKP